MSKKYHISIRLFLYFLMTLTLIVLFGCSKTNTRTVLIGVYNNPPKIEMKNGTPCGIFIDIIEYIGKHEGWNIKYIYGTWDECLTNLEKGRIDLMPDVAFSISRNQHFDFNQLPILNSWLQVYCNKQNMIDSISELAGKTIVVMKGSIQQEIIKNFHTQFNISFNQIELPDYEKMIGFVITGKADAAIFSRFYAYRKEKNNLLVMTPIILNPTVLHFAAAKDKNHDLLYLIDKYLVQMQNNPRSVYYRSLNYWLNEKPFFLIPVFVFWIIAFILAVLLFFLILSFFLKWQINKRTKELFEKSLILDKTSLELKNAKEEVAKREPLYAFSQIVSGIAHDFNNLLVPIYNYTEFMINNTAELKDHEIVQRNLKTIHSAANHGIELVRLMQRFYKSFNHPEDNITINPNTIIKEVIELAEIKWKHSSFSYHKPIKINLKLGEKTALSGKKSDIHAMMLNLLINAADAMPEGGSIEISTENIEGRVHIIVKDNGIGMTDEVYEKCLQPFFTTKGDKGTGMGLAMVNNIVAKHNGELKIQSTPGAGTSFIISFPCVNQ